MVAPAQRIAVLLAALCACASTSAQVTPPPLPIGSNLARPAPGMNDDERKRSVRAHHHKMQNKKDYTADDSEPRGSSGNAPGQANGNGNQANGNSGGKK